MTSEIRTNTLTSRAGLSTVTLTDSGPMFSGITTFVDNSTFSVGTGGTIHAPATNVMALGTNNIDAIKIDSSGNVNITGILTASSISGGVSLANGADNRVVTATGANAITGESNLTFNGITLEAESGSGVQVIRSKSGGSSGDYAIVEVRNSSTTRGRLVGDAAVDAFRIDTAGGASTPITFLTGSSYTERVRIASSGNVHIGSGDPTIAKLQVSGAGFFGSANTTKTNDGVIIERNSNDGLAHITAGRSGGNYSGFDFYVAGASGVTKRYSIDYQSNFKWFGADGTTERLRIASNGQVSISSDGTTDGLLTIKGNSDQVGTPSIRLLDGSDTREVSISNHSGDFVVSVHGNDNAIHGHIKMFESGQIDFNNGGASGSNTNRLRITSSGTVNIGDSSTQTTHLLHLQSTGDAGIHIRADRDNSGENDNPYLSMSQDGSASSQFKIGMNGDAGQHFTTSLANAAYIYASNSSSQPIQIAHMDNMCVNIAARKNEIALNDYSGNTIAGMEIHHYGNDTGAALKFSGHNNTGTPGVKTFTQMTHLGGDAKFMIHHMGSTAIQIGSTRRIDCPAVYGTAISSPMRDLYIESTGQMGYQPSIRASKINIADNNDVSWLYNLTPKTYYNRKRVSPDTNEWTNEAESDLQYGLIAEEVESVNSNICFYDVDESNNKTLAGVTYSQLITPLLKAVQDLKSEMNILQQENIALRARVTNLEGE